MVMHVVRHLPAALTLHGKRNAPRTGTGRQAVDPLHTPTFNLLAHPYKLPGLGTGPQGVGLQHKGLGLCSFMDHLNHTGPHFGQRQQRMQGLQTILDSAQADDAFHPGVLQSTRYRGGQALDPTRAVCG